MKTLFCVNDLSHDRFVQEIDGGYHKVQVWDGARERLIFEENTEYPVESHPFRCDVCGASVVDVDCKEHTRELRKSLDLLLENIDGGRMVIAPQDRHDLHEALKASANPAVKARFNALAKALWLQGQAGD